MAANNYYGFTHAGTQYGNQYTPSQQGYATAQPYPPPQGAGVSQGAQGYATPSADSYVISGYTRPAQPSTAGAQNYYTQQQSQQTAYPAPGKVPPQPQAARPAAPSTAYPTYTANTAGVTGTGTTTYAGFAQPQQPAPTGKAATFTNYDAAVYNAVTAYAQGTTSKGSGFGFKRHGGGPHMNKMKGSRPMQSKPQTLHYCDVCKISCAGPQTYKEHLEGQKHKKKEAAQKAGTAGTAPAAKGAPGGLRCELCDVTCTGSDAYAAHIRGAKHQKVLKLHTKLGKPIPAESPTVLATGSATNGQQSQAAGGANNASKPVQKQGPTFVKPSTAAAGTPKVSFIGPKTDYDRYGQNQQQQQNEPSQQQNSTQQSTPQPQQSSAAANSAQTNVSSSSTSANGATSADKVDAGFVEKDIQPVGQDYIEEVRSDDGKVVSFNCKLCECRFNDPNAKEMHMKGRRHRLQYKKKVNPDLVVDVKPSSRQKKIEERRAQRTPQSRKNQTMMGDTFPRGPVPLLPPGPGPRGFAPPGYGGPMGGPHMPPFMTPPLMRRPESMEDRHVMARHSDIYPREEELQAIQKIVSNTEKALKFVSDQFAEADAKAQNGAKEEGHEEKTEADLQSSRILKGVMRVGHLAKGLLLRGDRNVELVVLCSEKPTVQLLERIVEALPKHLQNVAPDEKYQVTKNISEAALVIISEQEPKIEVTVTMTSPLMRSSGTDEAAGASFKVCKLRTLNDGGESTLDKCKRSFGSSKATNRKIEDSSAEVLVAERKQSKSSRRKAQATEVKEEKPDVLDKEKCLDALAELRHAKWFQARATALQNCVIIIRILRDLCQRVHAWNSLPGWAVELLCEKIISSTGVPLGPGEALRIVLEVVSSGLLLGNGRGLLDPCEKEPVDALGGLTNQCREDITSYAQQALRQVAFRQIHKVLGMEPLPRFQKKLLNNRKRRRDNSEAGEGDETEVSNDLKKDKKEEGTSIMDTDVKIEATV